MNAAHRRAILRRLDPEHQALRHALATDGVAAARRLDDGDGLVRGALGFTSTASFLDCPRCGNPVKSGYQMTRLSCPYCRAVICETAGNL